MLPYQKYTPRTFMNINYNFQRRIGLYNIQTVGATSYGYGGGTMETYDILCRPKFLYVILKHKVIHSKRN